VDGSPSSDFCSLCSAGAHKREREREREREVKTRVKTREIKTKVSVESRRRLTRFELELGMRTIISSPGLFAETPASIAAAVA